MRVMLTGASGQLGWELARCLMPVAEVVAPSAQQCDLAMPEKLASVVEHIAPDVIINAAAYTAVDRAEQEAALVMRVNGEAVGALARAAKRAGALFVHYSTDYVFNGQKTSPYLETDAVAPLNVYGCSKLSGEQLALASGADVLVLRTTWVYAARGQNFVRTMLRLGRERKQLSVVSDQYGAPTWARNLADASVAIVREAQRQRCAGNFSSGLFHLTAGGQISWHGFATRIFALMRELHPDYPLLVNEVTAIPTEAYPTPACRPANSILDNTAVEQHFVVKMPQWQTALAACIAELDAARLP